MPASRERSVWSREENEAAVADYLVMLRAERAGVPYNKAEHCRNLARILKRRTHRAIEDKHQNISAVMIALKMPYVLGYKPLGNVQRLLVDVVQVQTANAHDLHSVLRAEVVSEPPVPAFDDVLAALVDPPSISKVRRSGRRVGSASEIPPQVRAIDYIALDAANRSLGAAGEEFAFRYEQARLAAARQERLALKVERVSVTRGDGLGYDILSFETDGRERLIEVKTTSYGPEVPFFITRNEAEVSRREAQRYRLYRIFDFRRQPQFFEKTGRVDHSFALEAIQYSARLRGY